MHKPLSIPGAALALLCAAVVSAFASGEWEELHGCRLIEHEANDGDSFHVDVDGEERIFRLYFVDSPESEAGGRVASRISDQAETFGITEEESIEIGKKAAAFTSAVLSRPFTVLTRGQNAMGASKLKREYAFVKTADGEDLGEMLVSRGLARSHGEDAATPDSKAGDLRDSYEALEAKARSEKVGAWGDSASVPTMALPDSSAPSTPLISFGSVTIGTAEADFRRAYPRAERGEDGHDETRRLHIYFLTPPDSIDADKTTFIFAKNRLIQINHNYDKPRVEERGGWQTDYENLSEMFESAGKPQEAHPLGPKTKHAFFWESKTTSDAASLDVFPDGSSQVTFYTTAQ